MHWFCVIEFTITNRHSQTGDHQMWVSPLCDPPLCDQMWVSPLCYDHAWNMKDIVIADNHALRHGRRAFSETADRHLRRVNVM